MDNEEPKIKSEWIPIDKLVVDDNYQRGEVSKKNTIYMATNFDWDLFGAILVAKRNDGKYAVIDGQQRLLAIKYRNEYLMGFISKVPAIISHSADAKDEADKFLKINNQRRAVTWVDKYKAALYAGHTTETEIDAFLKANGLSVCNCGSMHGMIKFIHAVMVRWERDKEATKKSLLMCKNISTDGIYNNMIFKGFFYLYCNGIDVSKYSEKIVLAGGNLSIISKYNQITLGINKGGSNADRLVAASILAVVNKGLHNKITLGDV